MSNSDGLLLVGGIIVPAVMLSVVYAALYAVLAIFVGYFVYYRVYKAHIINTHPDKILLEEIRSQRLRRNNYEQGKVS